MFMQATVLQRIRRPCCSMDGYAPESGVRQLNMKAFKSPEYAHEVG